jgi:ubiquinone biosynthesis protein COQ9
VKQNIGLAEMNKEKLRYERQRKKILKQALVDINTYGFNKNMLIKATENCNLSEGTVGRLFPEGIYELKEYFFNETDIEMLKKINRIKSKIIRIRDKIYNGVIIRLEIFQKNKDAIKQIFVSESSNPIKSIKNLWNAADLIWKSAGDTSTDYNHYTKRLLLSWVYLSTLICWFNDTKKDIKETKLFLNRRIDEVLQFGQKSSSIKSKISNFNIFNKLIIIIKELKSIKV